MKSDEALQMAEAGIGELAQALEQGRSEALVNFLQFQSHFHHYSFRNCMLIAMQNSAATYVAGFARWKQLGRCVKKGEKGLMILAPMVYKTKNESDGHSVEESPSPRPRGFRAAYVFDVAQTEGKELPEFSRISGEPGDKLKKVRNYIRGLGIELDHAASLGGADGISHGGRIEILDHLPPAEEFAVTVHELAHELLHRCQRRKETSRKVRELEAEAVAFVVCRAAGLEAAAHSVDYIHLYSGDKEMLMQSLDHIQRVSTQIIAAVTSVDTEDAEVSSKLSGALIDA